MDTCLYAGDATKQEALEKAKVHMGVVTTTAITCEAFAQEPALLPAVQTRSLADMQVIKQGTTSELRGVIKKQLH